MLLVRLIPETVTVCVEDATPEQLVKAESVPEVVIVGCVIVCVNGTTVDSQPVVEFLTVKLEL